MPFSKGIANQRDIHAPFPVKPKIVIESMFITFVDYILARFITQHRGFSRYSTKRENILAIYGKFISMNKLFWENIRNGILSHTREILNHFHFRSSIEIDSRFLRQLTVVWP